MAASMLETPRLRRRATRTLQRGRARSTGAADSGPHRTRTGPDDKHWARMCWCVQISETVFRGESSEICCSFTFGQKTTCLISIISNHSTFPYSGIQLASRAGACSIQRIRTWHVYVGVKRTSQLAVKKHRLFYRT